MALEQIMNSLPRVKIGTLPTPVSRLQRIEHKLNCEKLYIKRDDLTGVGPGGNKVRSLEYLIGYAQSQGCDTLIASGQDQSNLCTLAAAAAAKTGMDCVLIHNSPKPQTDRGNRLLNNLLGVETVFLGSVSQEVRETYVKEYAAQLQNRGKKPYIIENGATTGRGALGYVNAVLELVKQQVEQGFAIDHLFAPGGNGGIAAGLIYGNALLGFPFQIHIISVEDKKPVLEQHIMNTIHQIEEITGLPFSFTLEQAADITDTYRGEGWGINTPESEAEVLHFARQEGILIENVYTAKLMVGFQDYIKKEIVTKNACVIHTGGLGALFAQYETK